MDLIKNLPIDLLYIITNYDPKILFRILPKSELIKYDWFKLIKINFSLIYQRDACTNEEIMQVYLDNCTKKSKIVCGEYYTIIRLADGTLMSCGSNNFGQLGHGDNISRNVFAEIKGIGKKIVEVTCGAHHTIIRLIDGTLMGCGTNYYGQLGLGRMERNSFEEIKNIPKNITQVICGNQITIIKLTDGTLMACGLNLYGQLGFGDINTRFVFEEIKGIGKNIAQVICGINETIIRLTDGTLMVCGYNSQGQFGLGDNMSRFLFSEIRGIPKNIDQVICGAYHIIIRLTDGTLLSCGSNHEGQLGLGDCVNRNIFEKVPSVPKNIAEVICAEMHTTIRLTDGTLMRCGYNDVGQLGLGDRKNRNLFEKVNSIPKNIAQILYGSSSTIIRLTNGTLMACGLNLYGQLGFGDERYRLSFEKIPGIPQNIAEIICSHFVTIIRLTEGTLMACGYNDHGQLGLGDKLHRNRFEKIKGISVSSYVLKI
ncbi:MAG: chromosome condensation regulator [Hyperionvirus sp.]|uniref:Chromosome condensation regulator n=1 Tax=Hyperionvirus sp. TaxID=2487770 RepID=A0A3G5ABV4_9VIRU|nr:MAG: chromosome condensation regulator [Hyperionvirus sp.]